MKLTNFLKQLAQEGKAAIEHDVTPFDADDVKNAADFLQNIYQNDSLDMPDVPPQYAPTAAVWAAQFLYYALQCTVFRNLDAQTVENLLKKYPEEATPEAIYSVDLTFRYLPDLFKLAKGLAPDDILVQILRENAHFWHFSTVGMDVGNTTTHATILAHPSLRLAYIDRIIQCRDIKRVNSDGIKELVQTALGDYSVLLWPDFNLKNLH